MKRIVAAATGFAALIMLAGPGAAADLGRRAPQQMPVKAPYLEPIYNWTGLYVGINGGGAWGRSVWNSPTVTTGDFDLDGWLFGGTAGYNMQFGNIVAGIETDIAWTNISGTTTTACPAGCETKNGWLGTTRGRLGYAFDRFLPYVTGGAAYGDIQANPTGLPGASDVNLGWTAGGGIEYALTNNISAKAEYLYVDLGSINCSVANCGGGAPSSSVDFRTSIVRGGLNFRF